MQRPHLEGVVSYGELCLGRTGGRDQCQGVELRGQTGEKLRSERKPGTCWGAWAEGPEWLTRLLVSRA